MTIDETIIMLNAKAKCIDKKYICPDTDCDEDKCEDCELCYEQGIFGEQKSLMLFCAECLSELKELRSITKSDDGFTDSLINMGYTKGYNKGRTDAIDEYKQKLLDRLFDDGLWRCVTESDIEEIAEQLREKKNE